MMVTVYVSWEGHEIFTREQFDKEVKNLVENIKEDEYDRGERLGEFFDYKRLDCVDLFDMSEIDKQALREEFEGWLVKDAEAQLLDEEFEKIELNL